MRRAAAEEYVENTLGRSANGHAGRNQWIGDGEWSQNFIMIDDPK